MAYKFVYKGITFIEGPEPSAKILQRIEYKKLLTYNAHNKSLDCVKDQLVEKTIALGGNAVVNFKYGQKNLGWFKSLILRLDDNIKWYGYGFAAIIPTP
jgi:hypothetical protein